jgi:hypothetical protein
MRDQYAPVLLQNLIFLVAFHTVDLFDVIKSKFFFGIQGLLDF